MQPEYISINHRLDREFKPDPIMSQPGVKFQGDPLMAPGAVNKEFRDYMIPWYKDPNYDRR